MNDALGYVYFFVYRSVRHVTIDMLNLSTTEKYSNKKKIKKKSKSDEDENSNSDELALN